MTIQAISADGVTHEFPDETPDAVINGAMKSYAASIAPAAPESPGVVGYGKEIAKQVGIGALSNVTTAIQGLAAKDEESRRLESAIGGVMTGLDPYEAARQAPVPPLPLSEEPIYKAGEAIQTGAEKALAPTGILPPLAQDVARGAGSVVGNIVTSLVPGGAALIPLQGMGEAAQNAVTKGATPEQSERATQLGTIPGMTDFVDLLLPSLGGSTGKALGLIKRVGLRVLEGAFVEGGQEGLQQYLQNLITKGIYKPDQDVMEDVPRNALVGAIVGGGTSAVIGGHAPHEPVTVPPTPGAIAVAGTGIVAPPETPPPTAPPGPVQPELPLGPPPAAQGELPLQPPLTPAQQATSAAAIINYAGKIATGELSHPDDGVADPMLVPQGARGRSMGDALNSSIIAQGPLETRPQTINITPEMTPHVTMRPALEGEKVALPAIEYNGMLFPGHLHMEAVGTAMNKLGLSEDQIIDSPTFKEGFITTEGRFISREEAANIANRHGQFDPYGGVGPGGRLFAENLRPFIDSKMYTKAFDAIANSQKGKVVEATPAEQNAILTKMRERKAEPAKQLSTAFNSGTTRVQGVLGGGRLQGIKLEVGRTQLRPAVKIDTVHSTTIGNILPHVPLGHLGEGTVMKALSQALVQRIMSAIPNMTVHFIVQSDMERASPGAGGVYYSSPDTMGRPMSQQGPILISTGEMTDPKHFARVILHEATHAVTSNILRKNPAMAQRVRLLMNEALKYFPQAKGLNEKEILKLVQKGDLPYGFTNEREFLAEAFTRQDFQDMLLKTPAPRELMQSLGLEEKPQQRSKLWDAFIRILGKALNLTDNYQTKSLLDAVVRVGGETITAQEREVAAMQAKFNTIEPSLIAVPRQDATQAAYSMLKGLKDHIETDNQAEMTRQVGYADKMNWFYKWTIHAFQLGELNPYLAPLQRILEKARFASTEEARINDAALRVMKDWVNIGRGMSEKLTGLIDDIANMVYRTPSEVARGIGRKPTQAEFNTLVRKHGVNQDALNVLAKINTLFDKFLDLSSDLARNEAMKITDLPARIAALQAINQNVSNLKSKPYFPFMRYGRHVVLVRNQAGRVIHREHFERRGIYTAGYLQDQARKRLEQAFPAPQYKVEIDVMSESSKPMIGMPGIMLDLMKQKLNLTPQQLKALEQLRFELSPAQSYQHRMQNKSYTRGYSQDFQRSFAQYFFHGMKWYVKTKYADDMRANIQEIRDTRMQSLTPRKRAEIANFMEDWLQKGFLDPAQDFIAFKSGLVFYTLAYVPVSAVVNMSQTPMVSLPYLGAKFGDVRASAALLRAIGTGRNYYRKGGLAGMTSAEARALDYAIRTGRLEQTLATELASWSQGSNLGVGYGGTAVARTLHGIVEKGMWMFSVAEKWNRRIAFAAARELALAQPNSRYVQEVLPKYRDELAKMMAEGFPQHEAEAILVASHVVDQTQFMAGPDSRPKMMRGKLGTLLLYKRFIQGLMFATLNNKRDFAPRFMIVAMAMAGLSGVPGYEDISEIARVLGWWLFGKDFSVDREIRRLMKAMGAEDHAADQILHGAARTGFGVPWLLNLMASAAGQSPTVNAKRGYPSGPDISKSIGAGPILPVEVGKLFGPPINDPDKMFGEQAARAGGVMGQLAYNFYRAIESKDPGDFKRWELMMPRFAKDLSQVYRAYSTGKLAGKNDTAIIQFDTRDPEHLGELVGMLGGFQPRRLTARYEELRNQSEEIKYYDTMRSMILEQWATAIRGNNPDEREKMRIATQEFNASLPQAAKGFSLTSETIQRSVQQRLKSQQLMEAGFAVQRNRIPLIQETQKLYPESAVDVRQFGPNTIDAVKR